MRRTDGPRSSIRQGGTRAWRNNNPGNVKFNALAVSNGAIGRDGPFAIFPDPDTGSNALDALLHTSKYQNLTLDQAIEAYAPPEQNNTPAYQAYIRGVVGVPGNTTLGDLTPAQMNALQAGIKVKEGFHAGTVTHIPGPGI